MDAYLGREPHFVNSGDGHVPEGAVVSGHGNEGVEYVGRAFHMNCQLIGRVIPEHKVCYVSYYGKEYGISKYQVLVASEDQVKYVDASDGKVPRGAFLAGSNKEGKPLFVARFEHDGIMCGGYLNPEYKTAYVTYGGEEHTSGDYQVLCARSVVLH